jgi:hypothetical protein
VQLTARRRRRAVRGASRPGDVPRTDELAEKLQLLGVRPSRAIDVQRLDEAGSDIGIPPTRTNDTTRERSTA